MPLTASIAALLVCLLGMSPAALGQIARVLDSKGTSIVERAGKPSRILGQGEQLDEKDVISVARDSFAVLEFRDQTRITLRPNSVFRLDTYRDSASESMLFGLLKGGFRAVTGLIGKRSPSAVKFQTATATIGIRGTEFDARLCEDDCADEEQKQKPRSGTGLRAAARVVEVKGLVAASAAMGTPRLLVAGAAIYPREGIATGRNSYVILAFRDGSRITLAESSRLAVTRFVFDEAAPTRGAAYLRLLDGNAHVWTGELAKINPNAFLIESALGIVRPRGTGITIGGCIGDACASVTVNVEESGSTSGSTSAGVGGTTASASASTETGTATATTTQGRDKATASARADGSFSSSTSSGEKFQAGVTPDGKVSVHGTGTSPVSGAASHFDFQAAPSGARVDSAHTPGDTDEIQAGLNVIGQLTLGQGQAAAQAASQQADQAVQEVGQLAQQTAGLVDAGVTAATTGVGQAAGTAADAGSDVAQAAAQGAAELATTVTGPAAEAAQTGLAVAGTAAKTEEIKAQLELARLQQETARLRQRTAEVGNELQSKTHDLGALIKTLNDDLKASLRQIREEDSATKSASSEENSKKNDGSGGRQQATVVVWNGAIELVTGGSSMIVQQGFAVCEVAETCQAAVARSLTNPGVAQHPDMVKVDPSLFGLESTRIQTGLYVWVRGGTVQIAQSGRLVNVHAGDAAVATKDDILLLEAVPNFMRFDSTPRPLPAGTQRVSDAFIAPDGSQSLMCTVR